MILPAIGLVLVSSNDLGYLGENPKQKTKSLFMYRVTETTSWVRMNIQYFPCFGSIRNIWKISNVLFNVSESKEIRFHQFRDYILWRLLPQLLFSSF